MTRKLTVADAARELGVSESTVRRRVRRGDLPSLRLVEGGRDRTWVLLDEAAEAVPVSTVTSLAIVRPALSPGRGWCLRHRHSYEWLKSWGRDFEFTARFADAFWFASLDGARRAGRDLRVQLEAVEVARVRAA